MFVSDSLADFLRRPLGAAESRSCPAAARRSAALGERRILTAASLRVLAGLRVAGLDLVAALRDVGAAARTAPVLRLPDVPSDFAAGERVVGFFAARLVLTALVAGLRVVPASLRFARTAVAGLGERGVAGFARAGVLRALVDAFARVAGTRVAGLRVAAVRVDAARAAGARVDVARAGAARPVPARAAERPPAVRFAGAATLARVVLTAAALVPVLAPVFGPGLELAFTPVALPRVAGARFAGALAAFARDVGALATRADFGAALGPGFFAVPVRVAAVVPVRVVRVVAARALVPAVRRPPALIAMARVRPLSELSSLLMVVVLFRLSDIESMRDSTDVVGKLSRVTKVASGIITDTELPNVRHPA